MESKHIAITGGSGHLGVCLIEMLINQGYTVRALYQTFLPPIVHSKLTWIQGDINNKMTIENLINNTDILIHSAALISIGNHSKEKVFRVNVDGTESVLRAIRTYPKLRLIYISSTDAVQVEGSELNENSPYSRSTFDYPKSKVQAEKLILTAVQKNLTDAYIIRPSAIIGPADLSPSLLGQTVKKLRDKTYPMIPSGGYNMVDVRDVSQTIINSFSKGERGETYIVSGEYVAISDLAQIIDSKYSLLTISTGLLILLLPIVKIYLRCTNSTLPISKESLFTLKFGPKRINSEKARNKLNHKPRPIEESIQDLLHWFETYKYS